MAQAQYDYLFKVSLIGDATAGKTSLLTRFARNEFSSDTVPTIGVEFAARNVQICKKIVKAQVWDFCGGERFRSTPRSYYRGSRGAMLVYDISSYSSFRNVARWIQEFLDFADPSAVIMLVGNKSDLYHLRAVAEEEARAFAEDRGMLFMETSARDATNVEAAFQMLLTEILRVAPGKQDVAGSAPIVLTAAPQKDYVSRKCC